MNVVLALDMLADTEFAIFDVREVGVQEKSVAKDGLGCSPLKSGSDVSNGFAGIKGFYSVQKIREFLCIGEGAVSVLTMEHVGKFYTLDPPGDIRPPHT